MADPFDSLRRPTDASGRAPLPAEEVRRRGDRLRRRRAAVRVVGAACAVGVVTAGVALAVGRPDAAPVLPAGQPSRTADPSPAASPDASPDAGPDAGPTAPATSAPAAPGPTDPPGTEVPQGFPIAAGYPDPDPDAVDEVLSGPGPKVPGFEQVMACGRTLHPTTPPADRLAVLFQAPEDHRVRELTTYPDAETARTVQTALVAGFRDCTRESYGGTPESVTVTEVEGIGLGDEAYAVVQGYEVGGDRTVGLGLIHVVRVGNALLLSSTSSESTSDPRSVGRQLAAQQGMLAPVIDAMCVFGHDGC